MLRELGSLIAGRTAALLADSPFHFLLPPFMRRKLPEDASVFASGAAYIEGLAQVFVWYLLLGWMLYAVSVLTLRRMGGARFRYDLPLSEPGDKLSLLGGIKYVLPRSIYTHPSFKLDMMWLPFHTALRLLGLLTLAVGAGAVQRWLQGNLGGTWIWIPEGRISIALQVLILFLARDFTRFLWHYQAHKVPFFWEFHRVHHSAEVLHPFGVRTHPVDMLLRNSYVGVGGGLIAGSLIYLLGMQFNPGSGLVFAGIMGVVLVVEHFEHSHVSMSFGSVLDRVFYSPYMHQFHHGARPEHRDVNLGVAGGLLLWDRLFGTLYRPRDGEKLVWGASLEELGERNPHRTLWGLVWSPFVGAYRTLQRSWAARRSAAGIGSN